MGVTGAPRPSGADLALGPVRLRVADGDRARAFYERVLGLRAFEGPDALVELAESPDAPRRPAHTTGLFHLAILVPDRPALAHALLRVAASGWRLAGAADHLVSEALYLSDPEGNGIEIARDRPRAEWPREGGELVMATLPLDLDDLAAEAPQGDLPAALDPRARIGHVHLRVSSLAPAEDFYAGRLGLQVTARGYPGAIFLAHGGYHHHVGLNTWSSAGAPAPPEGALGLEHVVLRLPDGPAEGLVCDPSGNALLLA